MMCFKYLTVHHKNNVIICMAAESNLMISSIMCPLCSFLIFLACKLYVILTHLSPCKPNYLSRRENDSIGASMKPFRVLVVHVYDVT